MTPLKLALLGGVASLAAHAPAAAQHQGHHMPGMTMPMPAAKPPTRKPVAKKAAPKKAAAKKPAAKPSVAKKPVVKRKAAAAKAKPAKRAPDPHAGHRMPAPKKPVSDPHAGHVMPVEAQPDPHAGHAMPVEAEPDPHAGHAMPTEAQPDPHAGHDMSAMPGMAMEAAGTDLPAGDAPPPPVPTANAADQVYGEAMEMGRHHLSQFHGGQKFFQLLVNAAEVQVRKGRDGFEWDGEAWYGGDIHRLWLKSEGEGTLGREVEQGEVQALYSRAVGPYFNLQGGLRYDFRPNPSRVYATVGVEGLAPSFFDVEGALFLSNKGELMARAEGSYDQRITQRLILQPRAELNFAAQNAREIGVGAGLSDAEIGLRLRYDIRREFAPYVGVQYRRAFGRTRDYRRENGEEAGGWSLLSGLRLWF